MLSTVRGSKRWQRVVSVLSCVVVFCTTYALILPAITASKDTYCGLTEHIHSDECGEQVLTCTLPDESGHVHVVECYGSTPVLICDLPENAGHIHTDACMNTTVYRLCAYAEETEEHTHTPDCFENRTYVGCGLNEDAGHVHSDSCYVVQDSLICTPHIHNASCYTQEQICGLQQHTHTEDCYKVPDESETQNVDEWKKKLPETTGHWANDLLAAVRSQMGYAESVADRDENGNGRTFYGNAYGVPYANWDAAFVSWALEQIGVPKAPSEEVAAYFPQNGNTEYWTADLQSRGLFHEGKEGWNPRPGDLMFFSVDGGRGFKRVSVVVEATFDEEGKLSTVRSIMGDCEDKVDDIVWNVGALTIQGWARLPVNPDHTELYEEDELIEQTIPKVPVVDAEDDEEDEDEEEGQSAGLNLNLPDFPLLEGERDCNAYVGEGLPEMPRARMAAAPMMLAEPGIDALSAEPEGLDITNGTYYIDSTGIEVLWHEAHNAEETGNLPWKPLPTDGSHIPADAHLRIQVQYANVDPALLASKGYRITFTPGHQIKDLMASGNIKVGGEIRGTIHAEQDKVVMDFDPSWIDDLAKKNETIDNPANKKTVYGDFYFQGELDLADLDKEGGHNLHLGPVNIEIPVDDNAVAKFGTVNMEKRMQTALVKDPETGKYYLQYSLCVEAGDYGSPAVVVRDSMQASRYLVLNPSPYAGVTASPATVSRAPYRNAPYETVPDAQYHTSSVKFETRQGNTSSGNPSCGYDLVWEIGDMGPNESRTLTYRVEISPEYVGAKHVAGESNALVNEAELTSKGTPRDQDITTYVPKVDLKVAKQRTKLRDNQDGTFTATYRVMIQAPADNSYPLANLKFTDDFGDRTWDAYRAGVVNNIHYDQDSLKLTDGAGNVIDVSANHDPNPVWRSVPASQKQGIDESNPNIFDYYIGEIAPGETRYVEYTMTINANEAKLVTNGLIGMNNRAEIWDNGGQTLGYSDSNTTVDSQYWDRKSSPGQTGAATVIDISGADGYFIGTRTVDESKSRLPVDQNHPSSFTVPAGAFEYKVVVNESGQWDMSKALLVDQLQADAEGNIYLQFTGYARVDVYDKLTTTNSDGTERPLTTNTDNGTVSGAVNNALNGKTPIKTYWVRMTDQNGNALQSFGYTPEQLGIKDDPRITGKESYVVSYYAEPSPALATAQGKVVIGNAFAVSGSVVGPGGFSYVLQPMRSSQSVSVVGGMNYDVTKTGMYYEPPKADEPLVNRHEFSGNAAPAMRENFGANYWAITVGNGSAIPQGAVLTDDTQNQNSVGGRTGYAQSVTPDSVVGAYIVDLGQKDGIDNDPSMFDSYTAFDELVAAGKAVKLEPGVDYKTRDYRGRYCDIEMLRTIPIPEGSKVYFIIRANLTVAMPQNTVTQFQNYYKKNSETGRYAYMTVSQNGHALDKTAGNVFQVKQSGTQFGAFDRAEKKYVVTPGNQVIKDKGNNERKNQELQNSLLVVADSLDELWAAYDGKNGDRSDGTYQYWKDQVLNYTYQDGMYVTWQIRVNPDHNFSGPYSIIDTLPDGLELAYVRSYSGVGDGQYALNAAAVQKPSRTGDFNASRQATGFSDDFADWDEHYVLSPTVDDGANWLKFLTNYYTKGNQIAIHIPNLKKETSPTFQVVCRVTDPQIYFEDVEFTNTASLLDRYGHKVGTSGDTVWVRTDSVSKSNLADISSAGILTNPIMPYEVTVNPDAMDMDPNSDVMSVPLIDFMSSNLHMDMDSLRIYRDSVSEENLLYSGQTVQKKNAAGQPLFYDEKGGETTEDTGKPVMIAAANVTDATSIRVSSENGVRKDDGKETSGTFTKFHNLPDATKLVITYNVSATLSTGGQANSFSNKAYWDGYENVDNGETGSSNMVFQAGASAGANNYGGLQITKHDGNDESVRLPGATFSLYRAQYECYPNTNIPVVFEMNNATGVERDLTFEEYENSLVETIRDALNKERVYSFKFDADKDEYEFYWVNDNNPNDVIVGFADEQHLGYTMTHRTLYYSMDGSSTLSLLSYDYYTANIVIGIKFDQKPGFTYRHNILRDENGKAICEPDPIVSENSQTTKVTDANGIITYGLTAGEDAIHFNKVYCVKETAAPEGYVLDDTEYFFVVPNDANQFQDGVTNFFYRTEWPNNVHVVTRTLNDTPTYFLDVFNYKGRASVTKDFGGNGSAAKPGNYSFALYAEVDETGSPVLTSRVGEIQTIYYRDTDFTTSVHPVTGETIYTLKQQAIADRMATFDGLIFGQSYYLFEVNDAGVPIENGSNGTINENGYSVSYAIVGPNGTRKDGKPMLPNEVIPVRNVKPDHTAELITPEVRVMNSQYDAYVTKQFGDYSGEKLDKGLVGRYSFGIWPAYRVTDGVPSGQPLQTVSVEWKDISDLDAEKTAVFTGLTPGESYYIFEVDGSGNAYTENNAINVNHNTFVVEYLTENSFEVESDGEAPSVIVQNDATIELPRTGGIGTTIFYVIGGILAVGALILLVTKKRMDDV